MYTPYFFFVAPSCYYNGLPQYSYPSAYQNPAFSTLCSSQTEASPIKEEAQIASIQEDILPIKQEQLFKQEQQTKISRFKYVKKNVESNVVNQVISFVTTKSKSSAVLSRLLESNQKIEAFYEIMKQAKKKNRKYMGRNVLQSLLEIDEDHPVYILHKKLKSRVPLKLNEIRKALLKLTNYFLRNIIVQTLLTSSKLDKATLKQHLTRAREIYCYVNNCPSPYAK